MPTPTFEQNPLLFHSFIVVLKCTDADVILKTNRVKLSKIYINRVFFIIPEYKTEPILVTFKVILLKYL